MFFCGYKKGLPICVYATTADITDRNGALAMASANKKDFASVLNVLFDGAYSGEKFAIAFQKVTGCNVQVIKRSELHKFAVIPKRWVVERSFSWLDKCHRLWRNCERTIRNTCQMTVLAFIALLIMRF